MKALITGANGQVGQATAEVLSSYGIEVIGLSHNDLDITSREDVFACVSETRPDVVINTAAMTNVDACEDNVEDAFAINALAVRNLAQACDVVNAHLIHLSTDFVFDGNTSRPYSEFDITNPLSVYALSKLGGDEQALSYDHSTVLRVAWVFGDPNKDFFTWVENGVRDGSINALIDDQIGTPTYSYDIAQVIYDCALSRFYGLINVANQGETTRLEMGQVLCDHLGIDKVLEPIKADELKRPAKRPAYSALSTSTLERTIGRQMRSWEEALDDRIKRSQ